MSHTNTAMCTSITKLLSAIACDATFLFLLFSQFENSLCAEADLGGVTGST